jgi:hypothetical protein
MTGWRWRWNKLFGRSMRLIWRLPWLTEEFESLLPAPEVLARVQRATARPAHRLNIYPEQPTEFFRGKIFADGFEVTRAVSRPNAAEPAIFGVVAASHNQTTCRVRIHFRLSTLWWWIAWSIVALLWLLKAAGAFGGPVSGALLLPFFGLVASILLLPTAFGSELAKSRSYLMTLLELKLVA